jgi:hypothetical protein
LLRSGRSGAQLLGQPGLTGNGFAFWPGLTTRPPGCWQAAVASAVATRNRSTRGDLIAAIIATPRGRATSPDDNSRQRRSEVHVVQAVQIWSSRHRAYRRETRGVDLAL